MPTSRRAPKPDPTAPNCRGASADRPADRRSDRSRVAIAGHQSIRRAVVSMTRTAAVAVDDAVAASWRRRRTRRCRGNSRNRTSRRCWARRRPRRSHEQRDDPGDREDEAVPQAEQEAGRLAARRRPAPASRRRRPAGSWNRRANKRLQCARSFDHLGLGLARAVVEAAERVGRMITAMTNRITAPWRRNAVLSAVGSGGGRTRCRRRAAATAAASSIIRPVVRWLIMTRSPPHHGHRSRRLA